MKSTATFVNNFSKSIDFKIVLGLLTLTTFFLSGCTQRLALPIKPSVAVSERVQYLKTRTNWQVKGQIAFIQQEKRDKASMFWQKTTNSQSLTLSTYLGINVLSLNTEHDIHTLEIDGNVYHSDNLDRLIWQLTGLTFPSKALPQWIKALPYEANDEITNHPITQLPERLISFYNNKKWQINYKNYKKFNGVDLPTSVVVKQNGLTIKLAINQWII